MRDYLALGPPVVEWLAVEWTVAGYPIACRASGVCNDPLRELVELLAVLRDRRPRPEVATVELWLEPWSYLIDVEWWSSDELRVRVWFGDSVPPAPPTRGLFELVHEGRLPQAELGTALQAGLDAYFGMPPPATKDWCRWADSFAAFSAL